MKILYTVASTNESNIEINSLKDIEDWHVAIANSKGQVLTYCSTSFFDVIVVDATIENINCLELIKTIRDRQIFTPILLIAKEYDSQSIIAGLEYGADMCIKRPFDIKELVLKIRVLKRRNTNYQSPTISFEGIDLNRPDGKICYNETSLSVSPIEIEVFRLLTRASAPIDFSTLSEKIKEAEEKVVFFTKCLQKKIGLLNSGIKLEIKGTKCRFVIKK
jgi:DNA-binding response OmpR family regulator